MRGDHQQHAGPGFLAAIEEHCRKLGRASSSSTPRKVQGLQGGRCASRWRHRADAEIIGVIDADYVVQPDWLKIWCRPSMIRKVGLVQAPQDHRDGDRSADALRIMNGEYAGFFDIGMVQRNEANAIIVHGTMCLIRRSAMEDGGRLVRATRSARIPILACRSRRWAGRHALHQHALRLRPFARHLRGLQEAAPSLGLWRLPDRQEALEAIPARREPPHPRPAPRVLARLAQLARRGKPRRRGRDPQSRLGAGRRLRRHRHSRQDPDPADHRGLCRLAGAFPRALPPARRDHRCGKCWARCLPPCRCNGPWRARSATASSPIICPSRERPKGAGAGDARSFRRSGKR
jgi:hypothetical protein